MEIVYVVLQTGAYEGESTSEAEVFHNKNDALAQLQKDKDDLVDSIQGNDNHVKIFDFLSTKDCEEHEGEYMQTSSFDKEGNLIEYSVWKQGYFTEDYGVIILLEREVK